MTRHVLASILLAAAACAAGPTSSAKVADSQQVFAAAGTNAMPTIPTVTPAITAATSSAGDVTAAVAPDRDAADIAALRARGPVALTELLAAYDAKPSAALAATIDKVAGQRYATVSRMYWYTDLAQAQAAAKASRKPILSLRMLGRLDEDLSCANSRFFRTMLYANAALGSWMRDHFVLHWSSERPVPRVTIDYGDGRVLERTVTGNSAHYILTPDGHLLDVLPGLYAPSAFRDELGQSLALARAVAAAPDRIQALVSDYHERRYAERASQWQELGSVPRMPSRRGLITQAEVDAHLALAERAAMMKAYVEVPDLRMIDVGADPGALDPDDLSTWASIGQRLWKWAPPTDVAGIATGDSLAGFGHGAAAAKRKHAAAPHLLDAASDRLVLALVNAPAAGVAPLTSVQQQALLAKLDQILAADSAQNELRLRQQIHRYLAPGSLEFDQVNRWLYADIFHTGGDDPWLGLLPRDGFTGLPADGVTTRR